MKMNKRVLMGLGVTFVCLATAFAAVNIKGLVVDALTGYTVAGAAASNTVICGNGTVGTYQGSCSIAVATAAALAATPTQCSGGTPLATGIQANGNANCATALARTCNSNGCYIQYPDGTLDQWGTVFCSGVTCTVTFPTAFTTTTNLSFTDTPTWTSGNLTSVYSGLSTSGTTVSNFGVVPVGGGGTSYSGGATNSWHAIGN